MRIQLLAPAVTASVTKKKLYTDSPKIDNRSSFKWVERVPYRSTHNRQPSDSSVRRQRMAFTKENIQEMNLNKTERWISSAAGVWLLLRGLSRKKRISFIPGLMAIGGAELIRMGITGKSMFHEALGIHHAEKDKAPLASVKHGEGIKHEKTVTINRSPEELYRFWRNFENLSRFMEHLESVRVTGDTTSHWVAKAPAGTTVEWDAVIHNEIPNELIAWRSIEGSEINNAGSVHFSRTASGEGTEVKVVISYEPPAGKIGANIAKLFGEEPGQQLDEDLRRFKQLMEAGEIATTQGQPSARGAKTGEKALKGI